MSKEKSIKVLGINTNDQHFRYLLKLLKSLDFEVIDSIQDTESFNLGDKVEFREDVVAEKDVFLTIEGSEYLLPEVKIVKGCVGKVYEVNSDSLVIELDKEKQVIPAYSWDINSQVEIEYPVGMLEVNKRIVKRLEE